MMPTFITIDGTRAAFDEERRAWSSNDDALARRLAEVSAAVGLPAKEVPRTMRALAHVDAVLQELGVDPDVAIEHVEPVGEPPHSESEQPWLWP